MSKAGIPSTDVTIIEAGGFLASHADQAADIALLTSGATGVLASTDVLALAFIDAGRAWNDLGADEPLLLAAGPGARWDATSKIRAELYWGGLRRKVGPQPKDDLQDDGFHFMVSARVGF